MSHPAAGTIQPRAISLPAACRSTAEDLFRAPGGADGRGAAASGTAARNFAAIRRAWLARALGLGEPIRVNLTARSIDGRFETIDEEGRLVLARNDGARETISAGDVFFGGVTGKPLRMAAIATNWSSCRSAGSARSA